MKISATLTAIIVIVISFSFNYNIYAQEITIGTQTWAGTNLNVSIFRNGDSIPEAKTVAEWTQAGNSKKPVWCYYENDPINAKKYGKLYNWYAVSDLRGLAPYGWHVPNDNDWTILIATIGDEEEAGSKMKSIAEWVPIVLKGGVIIPCPDCKNWNAEYRRKVPCHVCKDTRDSGKRTPDTELSGNGTNLSGFGGLPGGFRDSGGTFGLFGQMGYWWSSTSVKAINAWTRYLGYDENRVTRHDEGKRNGLSVRCIKN